MAITENGKDGSPKVVTQEISFFGHNVVIEIDRSGFGISILDRLEKPEDFVGPSNYDTVVNFGSMCVEEGMRDYVVSESERWSAENPPPGGITILGFNDPAVQSWVDEIAEIAKVDFCGDESARERYYELNKNIFLAIAESSGMSSEELQDAAFLGLVRAGAVAGEMLGISVADQLLIQTKRLHIKGESEGDISIGISQQNPEQLASIDSRVWLIADPAGATLSSIEAVLINLLEQGVRPSKVVIWNTVISHKGAEFALNAIRSLGVEVEIVAGGYSSAMNKNYYLETPDGTPSVRDAGDALNYALPEEMRLYKNTN